MTFKSVRKTPKETSNCAIFGAISFGDKQLPGRLAIDGICEAEAARGGTYGNGVMFAQTERGQRGKSICVWSKEATLVDRVGEILTDEGIRFSEFRKLGLSDPSAPVHTTMDFDPADGTIYQAHTEAEYVPLLAAVVRVNSELSMDTCRVISFGHGLSLFKGLDSLSVLDGKYGLSHMLATAMIAHTRYPTGSSPKVVRAHPFSFGNVGIVHNGDVTSYRANLAACEARLAEIYHLFSKNGNGAELFLHRLRNSWAGTDSEVIAAMMYTMLKTGLTSEPGLSIPAILSALVPPFDNDLTRLLRGGGERHRLDKLAIQYKGFGLDGPVSSVVLTTYEDEVQLIAFRDRNTFRPLQIVIDHESGRVFVASELRQIIAATGIDIFSSKVESYSPDPGKFLWVSSKSGIVTSGRSRRPFIAAPKVLGNGAGNVNGVEGVCVTGKIFGKPHEFAGDRILGHRIYTGTLGLHGGSTSDGAGTLEIVGSVQDNCFEASSVQRVIVHGNASMMLGNRFTGEQFFLRGSADSRAFQQLRPKDGIEPTAIIGETTGQYLGKMMSGGKILVLGLEHLGREDVDTPIVGEFVGTGMVGGKIYIRGFVLDDSIKRPPERREVIAVCAQLKEDGLISESALREIRHNPLSLPRITKILQSSSLAITDPGSIKKAIDRLSPLFDSSLSIERRGLTETEIQELRPHLDQYFATFGLPDEGLARVLNSHFTIISVNGQASDQNEGASVKL